MQCRNVRTSRWSNVEWRPNYMCILVGSDSSAFRRPLNSRAHEPRIGNFFSVSAGMKVGVYAVLGYCFPSTKTANRETLALIKCIEFFEKLPLNADSFTIAMNILLGKVPMNTLSSEQLLRPVVTVTVLTWFLVKGYLTGERISAS